LLFDACAIYKLIWLNRVAPLQGGVTLELARWELGNALWREARLRGTLSPDEALRLLGLITRVLSLMEVVSIRGHEGEVLKLAVEEGLTFYDASYLYMAMARRLPLVTEDEALARVAGKYVKVMRVEDVLERGAPG